MFFIENEGQAVARTDYRQAVQAQAGYVYLSWNAGAARLLVPDAAKHLLREMRGAEYVIISKGTLHGRDALELVEGRLAFAVLDGRLKMTHIDEMTESMVGTA